MPLIVGPYFRGKPRQKPKQYGPISTVSDNVRDWFNRNGMSTPLLYSPFWEKTGNPYNYGTNPLKEQILKNGTSWEDNGILFDDDAKHIQSFNGNLLPLKGTVVFDMLFDLSFETSFNYFYALEDGYDDFSLYARDDDVIRGKVLSGSHDYVDAKLEIIDNKPHQIIFSWDALEHKSKLFIDGKLFGTKVGGVLGSFPSDYLAIGGRSVTAERYSGCNYKYFHILEFYISNDQAALLYDQPYAALYPRPIPFYSFVASGQTIKTINDSGSGADAIGNLAVALALADAGSGADAFAAQAGLSIADTGSGADSITGPSVVLQIGDAGSAADAVAFLSALSRVVESGSGLDALSITAALSVSDTGAGLDTATSYILISIAETGSGVDLVAPIAAALSVADSGSGIDALAQILTTLLLSDIGSGVDAVSVDDAGNIRIVLDAGSGSDAVGAVVSLSVGDTAEGTDLVAQIRAALSANDAGAGVDIVDIVQRLATINDIGSGADALGGVSVSVVVADAGAGADLLHQILSHLAVSDAGSGVDVATVIQFLARGKLKITLTAKAPAVGMSAKTPGVSITSKKPNISIH